MPDNNKEDQFQLWLAEMDDALDRFLRRLPMGVAMRLDYTQASLLVLEKWLLDRFPDFETTRPLESSLDLDGAARYFGETLRREFGGKWFVNLNEEKLIFFGVPQLRGMRGQATQICPLATITASTERRTGKFLFDRFDVLSRG